MKNEKVSKLFEFAGDLKVSFYWKTVRIVQQFIVVIKEVRWRTQFFPPFFFTCGLMPSIFNDGGTRRLSGILTCPKSTAKADRDKKIFHMLKSENKHNFYGFLITFAPNAKVTDIKDRELRWKCQDNGFLVITTQWCLFAILIGDLHSIWWWLLTATDPEFGI